MKEESFTVAEKVLVDGRAKQLTPDYYVMINSNTVKEVRVFLDKNTFEKIETGESYQLQIYKGALLVQFLKYPEMESILSGTDDF